MYDLSPKSPGCYERGAVTIFVCMMMLLTITVLVLMAYSLSTVNLQAVNNVQVREEGIASANEIIERLVEATDLPGDVAKLAGDYEVDVNRDSTVDFIVSVPAPECVRADPVYVSSASSVTLPGLNVASGWNTVWEISATATQRVTGTSVQVLQGVRILLTDTEKKAICGSIT